MALPDADSYEECEAWFDAHYSNGALITHVYGANGTTTGDQIVTHRFFVERSEGDDLPDRAFTVSFVDIDSNRPFTFYLDTIEEVDHPSGNIKLTSTTDDQFVVSSNMTDQVKFAVAQRKDGIW